MAWTIEAKILPLAGVAGHLYIEVFDDGGQREEQINGLATCPKTGKTRSVGKPGDLLKAYNTVCLRSSVNASRDKHPHQGCVLFSGSENEVRKVLEIAHRKIDEINSLSLTYKVLSQNSNSVFAAVVKAMAAEVPIDESELKKTKLLLPGVKNKLA